MNEGDYEAARGVAAATLKEHGVVLAPEWVDGIGAGLVIARDSEFFLVAAARADREYHERSQEKFRLLQRLIELYETDPMGRFEHADVEGTFPSERHYRMLTAHARDLDSTVAGLRALLETETYVDRWPLPALPPNRPPSAKNEGAICIFEILRSHGVTTWRASGIIADMFVSAGIESDAKKSQRALYDRLKRLVR